MSTMIHYCTTGIVVKITKIAKKKLQSGSANLYLGLIYIIIEDMMTPID